MKISVLFIITVFLISACGQKKSELIFETPNAINDVAPSSPQPQPGPGPSAFSPLKEQIIPKCITCHESFNDEAAIQEYIVPGEPAESPFFLSLEDGSMPMDDTALSTEELEIVRTYILGLRPTPQREMITFEQLKTQILGPHCLRCHRSMANEANLMGWVDLSNPVSSKMYVTVKNGSMPKRAAPLSAEQQEFILQYIKDIASSQVQP